MLQIKDDVDLKMYKIHYTITRISDYMDDGEWHKVFGITAHNEEEARKIIEDNSSNTYNYSVTSVELV